MIRGSARLVTDRVVPVSAVVSGSRVPGGWRCDALTARGRAGLDLAAVGSDRQIRDRGVVGLAGTVADHAAEPGAMGQAHRVQGLGHRADLVQLDQQAAFVQDSLSRSARGVVRGLHVRRGDGEAKLVRCSFGTIFDVVADLRPASPTYRNWESFDLHDDEQVSLYVPTGCAHGFQALTDPADVSYRIDRAHDPAEDVSIASDDSGISWPLPVAVMSQRDRLAPPLATALGLLP